MAYAAIAIGLSTLGLAQTARASDDACAADARAALTTTLDELSVAIGANDVEELERLWADSYRYVRKDGVIMDKPTRIARVRSGVARHSRVLYDSPTLRCYGDLATAMTRTLSQAEGAVIGSDLQVTHILRKGSAGWQVVLTHATAIAAEPID